MPDALVVVRPSKINTMNLYSAFTSNCSYLLFTRLQLNSYGSVQINSRPQRFVVDSLDRVFIAKNVHRRDTQIVLIWRDVLFLFAFQNKRPIYRYYPSCCECYSNCVHPLPYFPFPLLLERTHIL